MSEQPENPKAFPHYQASNRKYVGEVGGQPMYQVTDEKAVEGMSLRDYLAAKAMLPVMGETQEMRVATFWDWIKDLFRKYLGFSFLTVKYKKVDNVYDEASKRCFDYADAMLKERAKK